MVFWRVLHRPWLASVLVSVAAVAAAAVAVAAAVAAAAVAAAAAAEHTEIYRHLRPMHRRSERPELHSLAQLSVELRRQPGVLHHVDRARHRKAPDSDLLSYGGWSRLSPHT
jgi:hypothetical protein